jgi:hypothetical protein
VKRLSLILIVSLFSVFYVSSIEVTIEAIESPIGEAYIITGRDLPEPVLFAFNREHTEEIAACFEEMSLLENDYDTLNTYATRMEEYADSLKDNNSRLRRWNVILGSSVVGIGAGLLTYAIWK